MGYEKRRLETKHQMQQKGQKIPVPPSQPSKKRKMKIKKTEGLKRNKLYKTRGHI